MTASTTTGARAASTFPVYKGQGGGDLCAAYGTHTFAAGDDEADDIYRLLTSPPCTVLGGEVYGGDLDTGTESVDFNIGWSGAAETADPDGFGNFGVVTGDAVAGIKPEVSIWMPLGGVLRSAGPQVFASGATIELIIVAAANTLGTVPITVVVHYITS